MLKTIIKEIKIFDFDGLKIANFDIPHKMEFTNGLTIPGREVKKYYKFRKAAAQSSGKWLDMFIYPQIYCDDLIDLGELIKHVDIILVSEDTMKAVKKYPEIYNKCRHPVRVSDRFSITLFWR